MNLYLYCCKKNYLNCVCMDTTFRFHDEWEDEFLSASYQPSRLIFGCWLAMLHYSVEGLKGVFWVVDEAGGSFDWILWTYASYFVTVVISLTIIVAFKSSSNFFRKFCKRNYNHICVFAIVTWYFTVIYPHAMIEYRRSRFHFPHLRHITWSIDFSGVLPVRICTDSDPLQTWTQGTLQVNSVGCNSILLGGGIFLSCFHFNLAPVVLNMRHDAAFASSAATLLIFAAALTATGAWLSAAALAAASIQICAGLAAAYLC